MSESLKGFYTVLMDDPPRIQVKWDWITQSDFEGVEVAWWRIGSPVAERTATPWKHSPQFIITIKPGETYVVAARAHFAASPITGVAGRYLTEWAYAVIEVPQDEQYTDLGQVTVIDTPRGPAILLDELWEARG